MKTTRLVTSGLYAIVRHPQYLAGDFLVLAIAAIVQHWVTLPIAALAIVTNRLSMRRADRELIRRFGAAYREYMDTVPPASLLLGLWRMVRRSRLWRRGRPSSPRSR
jgi:protein-S-isoprenylcysteine O-methyltransferase Ste14